MNQALQELVDSRGAALRVDQERGVIRGVKILGLESRNGRSYRPAALREAIGLYEGAKVNVNHPKGGAATPRDYQDRLGAIRAVEFREAAGLFGDLHFNPRHTLAEQLAWDAMHAPENVGFSHNVEARMSRDGVRAIVEVITRVVSVDLVADPATTRGLFEQSAPNSKVAVGQGAERGELLTSLTRTELQSSRPDLIEECLAEARHEIDSLRDELHERSATSARGERRELVRRLLAEHQLPAPEAGASDGALVDREFLDALDAAGDEAGVRRLVEARAILVRAVERRARASHVRPLAREQSGAIDPIGPRDAREFAAAIT